MPVALPGPEVQRVEPEVVAADDQRRLGSVAAWLKQVRRAEHAILGLELPKQLPVLG